MSPGIWQILIVLAIALLIFGGRGRISAIMGDLARGITSFRQGLREDEQPSSPAQAIPDQNETVDVTPEPEAPTESESATEERSQS